jgi:hypothetical protein
MAEKDWYAAVEAKLGEQLFAVVDQVYLETGATKGFSERVKAVIPAGREIVFSFLR